MRSTVVACTVLVLSALTSGCGNLRSINHSFLPDRGHSISVDANQRAIYSLEKIFKDPDSDQIKYRWRAVCAEPSPDALSSLAASGGLTVEGLQKAISGAFSSQEAAASIGLRTQTIQILRDAMYRLCEGYASGALDNIGFTRLQRRYQNIMMGLLAIEQITGAVVAKQVILTGSAEASVARSLAEIQAQLNEATAAKQDVDEVLGKATTAKTEADTAAKDAEKAYQDLKQANGGKDDVPAVKEAKEKRDDAQKKAADAKTQQDKAAKLAKNAAANVQAYEELRNDLGKVATRAVTTAASEGGGHISLINAQTAATLSAAVKDIVQDIVSRDYGRESCMDAVLSRDFQAFSSEQFIVAVQFCTLSMRVEARQIAMRAREKATPAEALVLANQSKAIDDSAASMFELLTKLKAEDEARRAEKAKLGEDKRGGRRN